MSSSAFLKFFEECRGYLLKHGWFTLDISKENTEKSRIICSLGIWRQKVTFCPGISPLFKNLFLLYQH